jgi:hypothetical protein
VANSNCSVEGCDQPHYGRGWCRNHYRRWQHHGDPLGGTASTRALSVEERFWLKVENSPTGCWIWIGSRSRLGYGNFWHVLAHRFAYELLISSIPVGLELDHLCRNRACVNPTHLEPVTRKQNMERATNASKEICPAGHPYTPENTYMQNGSRHCRQCNNEAGRRYRERHQQN